MQTGAVRDRDRWLLSLALAACAAAAPAACCRGQTAWEQGLGGAVPPRHLCLQAGQDEGGHLFAGASAEQPWGLPGVLETTGEVFLRTHCCIVRWRWERLGCDRYAGDLIEGSFGVPAGRLPLFAHCIGRYRGHAAEGFPAVSSVEAGWAVSVAPFDCLTVGAQHLSRISVSGDALAARSGEEWLLSASAARGGFTVMASLHRADPGRCSLRIGLVLGGPMGVRFALGMRADTGEVSGGLQYGGAVSAAVSWRMHPALGTSVSCGAGVSVR